MAYFKELGEKLRDHHDNMEKELKEEHNLIEQSIQDLQETVTEIIETLDKIDDNIVPDYTDEEVYSAIDNIFQDSTESGEEGE
jgi:esterase/lipase